MRADNFLENKNIDFDKIEQDNPTKKCSAAADERGMDTSQIVKSLIIKKDGKLFHVCIPGDRTLSEKRFGEHRMADPEQSLEETGQESGTVHPFSSNLKHFVDERIFEKDIVSFTVGTESEAVKIKSEKFKEALKSAEFEYKTGDFVVSNEEEVCKLIEEGLQEQDAKFVAKKGYRKAFFLLQNNFEQPRILKLLLEIDRHGITISEDEMREILDRAESKTHLQKTVENFVENGELPDEQEDFDLEATVSKVVEENPDAVEDLKDGRDSSINYLIGRVMEHSQGKADADEAKEKIRALV